MAKKARYRWRNGSRRDQRMYEAKQTARLAAATRGGDAYYRRPYIREMVEAHACAHGWLLSWEGDIPVFEADRSLVPVEPEGIPEDLLLLP